MTPENTIDIVLVTWPNHPRRMEYLRRVWQSLQENLTVSRHGIRWLCSAESERDPKCQWCGDDLERFCAENMIELHWRSGPASLGANMNAAVALCTSRVYVLHQDDFQLLEPLDLSPWADFMLACRKIDLLRLSYFTDPKDGTKFLPGELVVDVDGRPFFRFVDINATWPYGDDPQMRRQDFVARHGKYLEGGRHGASESEMLLRLVKSQATIAAGPRSYYVHIGGVAAVPESQEFRRRAERRN